MISASVYPSEVHGRHPVIGVVRLILVAISAFLLVACSRNEEIVKECGADHPHSVYGQLLCQWNKEQEIKRLQRRVAEAERQRDQQHCAANFMEEEFPAIAKRITAAIQLKFSSDANQIQRAVVSEFSTKSRRLEVGVDRGSLNAPRYGTNPTIEFEVVNKCKLDHLRGIISLRHDADFRPLSVDSKLTYMSNNKQVTRYLRDQRYPLYGFPTENLIKLGKHQDLLTELEKKYGRYDKLEGCFYFQYNAQGRSSYPIQTPFHSPRSGSYRNLWPEDEKYCLFVNSVHVKTDSSGSMVNLLLVGDGITSGVGRPNPGVVSLHAFYVTKSGVTEKFYSLFPLGEFTSAPKTWRPQVFNSNGDVGWIGEFKHCAQGCSDEVVFLVPNKNKYWLTELTLSPSDGRSDFEKNNYKISYRVLDDVVSSSFLSLRLAVVETIDGKTSTSQHDVFFSPQKNRFIMPTHIEGLMEK